MKKKINKLIILGIAPIHLINIKRKIRFEDKYIAKQKKSIFLSTNSLQLDPYYHNTI